MSATRRRLLAIGVVAAVSGAGGVWAGVSVNSSNSASRPPTPAVTGVANVVLADLAAQQTIPATIGYDGQYTVLRAPTTGAQSVSIQGTQSSLATQQPVPSAPEIYTWLPRPGEVISESQPVYRADEAPIPLLYGNTPLYRDLRLGISAGSDVGELTHDLITLGFGPKLTESKQFSAATAAAVSDWQAAIGRPRTGCIALGDAIIEPGPIRVSSLQVLTGAAVTAGPILDATSTELVATALVPLSDLGSIKAGDAVTVDLPGSRTAVAAHIRDVGTTFGPTGGAISGDSTGSSNQSGGSQNAADQNNGTTSVAATVTFSDAAAATQGLNQAAVLVHVTTQTAHGVLVVPFEALLALAAGGEGVEIVGPGGTRRVVSVQTGLFSGTQVEITGAGITVGTQVEVAAG